MTVRARAYGTRMHTHACTWATMAYYSIVTALALNRSVVCCKIRVCARGTRVRSCGRVDINPQECVRVRVRVRFSVFVPLSVRKRAFVNIFLPLSLSVHALLRACVTSPVLK